VSWTFLGVLVGLTALVSLGFALARRLDLWPRRLPREANLSRADLREVVTAVAAGRAVSDPRLAPLAHARATRAIEWGQLSASRGYAILSVAASVFFLLSGVMSLLGSEVPYGLSQLLIAAVWMCNPILQRRGMSRLKRAQAVNEVRRIDDAHYAASTPGIPSA